MEIFTNRSAINLEKTLDLADGSSMMGVKNFSTYSAGFNETAKISVLTFSIRRMEGTGALFGYLIEQTNYQLKFQIQYILELIEDTTGSDKVVSMEMNTAELHSFVSLANGYEIYFLKYLTKSNTWFQH